MTDRVELLHIAICQAVQSLNVGNNCDASSVLRQALVDYADRPAGRDIEKAGGDEIGWAYMVYVSSLEDTDSPVPSSADAFFAGYQAALEREKGQR